ncbi:hypothetical protein L0Z14_00030 [Burkholderia multivorans]|uniref:hypothetical protein n=1 Tax=Burkholderia multivorans TaxID=87883 RepID=UPI00201B0FED|nr:hypothetical protein [Burkholderia multivorans]MCL4659377.1 hypothetical protein [Burkholderia multivorans]
MTRDSLFFIAILYSFGKGCSLLAEMKEGVRFWDRSDLTIGFLSGTVYFEAGDLDKSAEFFVSLYEQFGNRPFAGEDKKYLEFAKRASKEGK